MAKRFSIETTFQLFDKISAPMRNINKNVNGFGKSTQRAFAKSSAGASGFGNTLGNLKSKLFAAFSVVAVTQFAKKSIDAWVLQEQAMKNVEAGIISTGNAAGLTFKQLTDEASALQEKTFFGDENILKNVTAQMQTFTNITDNQFKRAQVAVLDVTAKLKGLNASGDDLRGVSIQLSKALNDPIANLSALSRSGIQFSQSQKTMIKSLWTAGKTADAQNIILQELEKQYGGTASALAAGGGGKIIQLNNLIGDSMEQIGKKLLPLKVKFLEGFLSIMPVLTSVFNALAAVLTVLVSTLEFLKPALPIILSVVGAWYAYSKALVLVTTIQTIFNKRTGISKIKILIIAITVLVSLIKVLSANWKKLTPNMQFSIKIIGTLAGVVTTLIMIYKSWATIQKIINLLMLKNPYVLIILAITAMAAGIAYLISNWENLSSTMKTIIVIAGVLIGVIVAIIAISKAWAAIQLILNVLLFANPIGLIVLAVVAVIAAVVLLIKYWDVIVAKFKAGWKWVKGVFGLGDEEKKESNLEKRTKEAAGALEASTSANREAIGGAVATRRTEETKTTKSTVDININNAPSGTSIKQKGRAPGVNVAMGAN